MKSDDVLVRPGNAKITLSDSRPGRATPAAAPPGANRDRSVPLCCSREQSRAGARDARRCGDTRIFGLDRCATAATDQQLTRMRMIRDGASDKGFRAFDAMDEAVSGQEVEAAVNPGRGR